MIREGNVENILNNLTHEIFHVGYSHMRRERTEIALQDTRLYGMLDYLQNEGMATYVGYEAVSLFPRSFKPMLPLIRAIPAAPC